MQFDPERITFFARTDARGREVAFGIKAKDRTKHMYVIGKTGMGKSTMLENMAVQDIKHGEGMAFMDPHGATAEKILEYIPESRMKDVLYFAPFDMGYPMSFNVMEDVGYDKRHLVVSGLMSTFKKIWVDAWSARMEYILSNTMLALLEYPGATLLGVNRMLSDPDYRKEVVANVKDPSVRSFWVDEFAKYNERYMQEAGDAIKNKVGQFTANPLIRNIVGQEKSSFDIRQMMEDRKILIINLSKGLVGETNANLLGSMFITRIYLAAMSRADMPPAAMAKAPNFYLYVDEFQSFANETFANILSEARKYKLNLTIAHQYVEQMEEEVRNAVFGNVGTTISFRVGPFDAETLEVVFAPQFTATDLVNLGFAQIYLTLMIDGIGSKPFSAVTLPPIPKAEMSHVDQVIAASRAKYSRPRAEVEELIRIWHEPIKKPARVIPAPTSKDRPAASKKEVKAEVVVAPTAVQTVVQKPVQREDTKENVTAAVEVRPKQVVRPQESKRPPFKELMSQKMSPSREVHAKNVDDLRSILERISKQEKQKVAPQNKAVSNTPTSTTTTPRDLKSALRSVLDEGVKQSSIRTEAVRVAPSKQHANPQKIENTTPQESRLTEKEQPEMTLAELQKILAVSKNERPPVRE